MFGDHGLAEAVVKNLLKIFTWMGAASFVFIGSTYRQHSIKGTYERELYNPCSLNFLLSLNFS